MMGTLNEPLGWQDEDDKHGDWTPAIGLRRAVVYGLITSLLLVGILSLLAWLAPAFFSALWLRVAVGFAVAWALFGVVQRAAGMVGWLCTGLAVGLAALTLILPDTLALLAGANGAAQDDLAVGEVVLLVLTYRALPSLIGILICAVLCHNGAGIGALVSDVLMRNPLWPRSRS
jgi:hypothetical protein